MKHKTNLLSRLKKDNKGSSFVLVLVSIALIMILVAVIFVLIFLQYKMLSMGRQSKNNFYYLEEVLDEMRVGVGNESIKQLKSAYDETVAMVVYYDTDQQKYMSVSSETASNILNNKFLNRIAKKYCTVSSGSLKDASISKEQLESILLSYVQNVDTASRKTKDNVKISFGSNMSCKAIQTSNPVTTIGYRITGVKVERTDARGNTQSISTDLTIYPPKDAMNFLASADDINNVFTYAMVADYGINISGGATTDVRVTGNIYAASNCRNNGIYQGDIVANPAGSTEAGGTATPPYRIENSKPGVLTGEEKKPENLYSGIYVTDKSTSFNLQSDIISVNGSITANNGAIINGNTKSENSSRTAMANLWTDNITTLGNDGSSIYLKAQCSVSDDLELNGTKSKVDIDGLYYGYNYAAEEESQLSSNAQITTARGKSHTNSSAIIINGEESSLNFSKLTEMVINGRSYIDILNEAGASKHAENDDIKTAESVSGKENQLVYRVLESKSINKDLPTLNTTGIDKAGHSQLSKSVPYYNMIKFLTYQFFKDEGYRIYNNSDATNELYDSNWQGINENSYNKVWDDIVNHGKDSNYYQGIVDVYFPQDKKIVAKSQKVDGKYVYERKENSVKKVTDAVSNEYDIYNNTDTIPTSSRTSIHQYGFVTVGDEYQYVSLFKVLVGNDDPYYYYQFYDEKAKAEFVLDYADYTANNEAIDDVTSTDTFALDRIELPDSQKASIYTRGISTVLESNADKYKLKAAHASSEYDEAKIKTMYDEKVKKATVYKCYFPKAEASINDNQMTIASNIFNDGKRDVNAKSSFSYSSKGDDISPLTNPSCLAINWQEVADKESAASGAGTELEGYNGARVWVSKNDIEIDGSKHSDVFKNRKTSGIVLCMGNVTIKNLSEFTGTIIAAGKINIQGETKFYCDDQLCNNMLENDTKNQIRTCFGLKEFQTANDNTDKGKTISSIVYTDLVGYDNWIKNGE